MATAREKARQAYKGELYKLRRRIRGLEKLVAAANAQATSDAKRANGYRDAAGVAMVYLGATIERSGSPVIMFSHDELLKARRPEAETGERGVTIRLVDDDAKE